jgi:hypothetical protein
LHKKQIIAANARPGTKGAAPEDKGSGSVMEYTHTHIYIDLHIYNENETNCNQQIQDATTFGSLEFSDSLDTWRRYNKHKISKSK